MTTPDQIPTEKRQLFISDGSGGAGRFKFACFVTNFSATEQRNLSSKMLRDCTDPAAAPVKKSVPMGFEANHSLSVVANPQNARYRELVAAVRSGALMEFMDKTDLTGAEGGGADTFFAYVTSTTEEMPEQGTVTRTFGLTIDGAKTWTAAA